MRLQILTYLNMLFLCVALSIFEEARAAIILDQSYESTVRFSHNIRDVQDVAQTFTVGEDGTLAMLEVLMTRAPMVAEPLMVDVRTVEGGSPSVANSGSNVLATATIDPSQIPDFNAGEAWISIDLSGFGVSVTTGDQLAIVLRSNDEGDPTFSTGYLWRGGDDNGGYALGSEFTRFPPMAPWIEGINDKQFRTYVDVAAVPEPSAIFATLAVSGMVGTRRKRRANRRL